MIHVNAPKLAFLSLVLLGVMGSGIFNEAVHAQDAALKNQSSSAVTSEAELAMMQEEINRLKATVFKAKAGLAEIENQILAGEMGETKAIVRFVNAADTIFDFDKALFYLNDQLIYTLNAPQLALGSDQNAKPSATFHHDALNAGEQKLRVEVFYQGSSSKAGLKPFKYFQDKAFHLKGERTFYAPLAKTMLLNVNVRDLGYILNKLDERLVVDIAIQTSEQTALETRSDRNIK